MNEQSFHFIVRDETRRDETRRVELQNQTKPTRKGCPWKAAEHDPNSIHRICYGATRKVVVRDLEEVQWIEIDIVLSLPGLAPQFTRVV
jgi:hypothetical protein